MAFEGYEDNNNVFFLYVLKIQYYVIKVMLAVLLLAEYLIKYEVIFFIMQISFIFEKINRSFFKFKKKKSQKNKAKIFKLQALLEI